jgi:ubiquinone/menaquinone biosynthesis C-methylase UbiE
VTARSTCKPWWRLTEADPKPHQTRPRGGFFFAQRSCLVTETALWHNGEAFQVTAFAAATHILNTHMGNTLPRDGLGVFPFFLEHTMGQPKSKRQEATLPLFDLDPSRASFGPTLESFMATFNLAEMPELELPEQMIGTQAANDSLVTAQPESTALVPEHGQLAQATPPDEAGQGSTETREETPYVAPVATLLNQRHRRFSAEVTDAYQGTILSSERINRNIKALQLRNELVNAAQLPNEEQAALLAQYTGWGGLAGSVSKASHVLTEQEASMAGMGVLTQHHTPGIIIEAIYAALVRMGVKPKRILDPAAGTGRFFALLPQQWLPTAHLHAADIDPVSTSIMQLLLPDVHAKCEAFQNLAIADNSFDLVVTNVPFDQVKVCDKEDKSKLSLHNFFLRKALRKCRPGGVVAIITSTSFLDGIGDSFRKSISSQAKLMTALRLPTRVFRSTAGVEVGSDIIIFKKYTSHSMRELDPAWVKSDYNNGAKLNQYMVDAPHRYAGQPRVQSGKYGPQWEAISSMQELPGHLANWVNSLEPDTCATPQTDLSQIARENQLDRLAHLRHESIGSFVLVDGHVHMMDDNHEPIPYKGKPVYAARIKKYIALRTVLKRLLIEQAEISDDAVVEQSRRELGWTYDAFVKEFGYLSDKFNKSLLRDDPSYPLVASLEVFDPEKKTAEKAVIFFQRTHRPVTMPTTAACIEDALKVVLGHHGKVDPTLVGKLIGVDGATALHQLQQKGLVFIDPASNLPVIKEVYLSGNIHTKRSFCSTRFQL